MAKKPIQSSKTDDDNENNKKMMIATTTTPQTKPKANTTTRKTKSSKHIKRRRNKYITRKQANTLVAESEIVIRATLQQLEEVRELALKAGLTVDSNIVPKPPPPTAGAAGAGAGAAAFGTAFTTTTTTAGGAAATATTSTTTTAVEFLTTNVFATTGGHNNTDHVIVRTGNPRKDRIAELKRNLQRRHRAMQPENRGEDRWDQPKVQGGRRRRIVRDKDLPNAPPEPPPTGYVVFVGQMTTKIRHDRPNVPHDQAKVVQEISKIWRIGMTEDDRNYYNDFAMDAKREYEHQVIEYRATGSFTPSKEFSKIDDVNVWIRKQKAFQNKLEREISNYDTCLFPKRPPQLDRAYEEREERSKLKRKLKVKGLVNDDGTLKDGLDFEELLQEGRQKVMEQQEEEDKDPQDNQ